jgi:hypothetical protein
METTTIETKSQCPTCAGEKVPHTVGCPVSPGFQALVPAIPEFLQALSLMTPVDRMKTCIVACLEAWKMSENLIEAEDVAVAAAAGAAILDKAVRGKIPNTL